MIWLSQIKLFLQAIPNACEKKSTFWNRSATYFSTNSCWRDMFPLFNILAKNRAHNKFLLHDYHWHVGFVINKGWNKDKMAK